MPTIKQKKQKTTAGNSKNSTSKGPEKVATKGTKKNNKIAGTKAEKNKITEQSLLFKGEKGKLLSPGQKKFNRQIKQLESLQKRVSNKSMELDQMLEFYGKKIYPIKVKEEQLFVAYVKAIFTFYKRKRRELTAYEHKLLGRFVKIQFEKIDAAIVDEDKELHIIWKKLYKQSYQDSVTEDLNDCKAEAIEQLYDIGVEFDPKEIEDIDDFNSLNEKVFQLIQDFLQQKTEQVNSAKDNEFDFNDFDSFADGQQKKQATDDNQQWQSFDFNEDGTFKNGPKRKKTAAQLKKEQLAKEKEAIKLKSISTIYKQLAKIFHPDLEPDDLKKIEKEALMQQLTQAYQQRDLHTLLRLELGWIHKEKGDIQQMAEDKLSIYNEILKEQIEELKIEEKEIESHPKYEPILYYGDYEIPKLLTLKRELKRMNEHIKMMKSDTDILLMNNEASILLIKDNLKAFDYIDNSGISLEDLFATLM